MSFQEFAESAPRSSLKRPSRPVLAGAAAIICIGTVTCACAFASAGTSSFAIQKADASVEATVEGGSGAEEAPAEAASLYVHVAGCVAMPGVCELKAGARLADAIEAAGGFTADAAAESVNLAREVQDGEQVIVASQAEMEAAGQGALSVPEGASAQAATAAGAATDAAGRVNINLATDAELQTISGIGPAKAQKIIAYRESNGPFKMVDDLCNVSGIGAKTLEAIRDQVCV